MKNKKEQKAVSADFHLFSCSMLNFMAAYKKLLEMGASNDDFYEVVAKLIKENYKFKQHQNFLRDIKIYLDYRLSVARPSFVLIAEKNDLSRNRISQIIEKMDRNLRAVFYGISSPPDCSKENFGRDDNRGRGIFKKEIYYQVLEKVLEKTN
jgi:hypothetical protein